MGRTTSLQVWPRAENLRGQIGQFLRRSLEVQGVLHAPPHDQWRVEQRICEARWLMIVLALVAVPFIPFLEPARLRLFAVVGVATLYNLLLHLLIRTRTFPFLRRGYVSMVADLILTIVTVVVSGGLHSPLFVAFFPLVVVIGLRFGAIGSFAGSALITLLLLAAMALGMPGGTWPQAVLQLGFLWITSVATGVLADTLGRTRYALAEQLRRARALHAAAQRPSASLSLEEVLQGVAEEARGLVEASYSLVVYAPEENAPHVHLVGAQGGMVNPLRRLADTLASRLRQDPAQCSVLAEEVTEGVVPHVAAVALSAQERVVGCLAVARQKERPFDRIDAEALTAFARSASLALQNAQFYQDLQARMEELRQTQAQLVQSAKLAAIGELAAQVAHEINNPLGGILLQLGLLLEDGTDPAVKESLQAIEQEVLRARGIVSNLLDFARQSEPGIAPVGLNELVASAVALSRHRAALQRVETVEQYDPALTTIEADGNQLKQVWLNIVTNALDVMPHGGTLTVATQRRGAYAVVTVRDTGPGMSPEVQARIFEPFFTTKGAVSGTGLGLAVSHGIVARHGGRIEVETAPGKGATFAVWLPVTQPKKGRSHVT